MKWSKLRKKYLPLVSICILFILVFSLWLFLPSFSSVVTSSAWDGSTSTSFSGGNGTINNPYLIENGSDLALLKEKLEGNEVSIYKNKHYKLATGINLGNLTFSINNLEAFTGSIDGDANYIINANIPISLFKSVENATFKNINFQDCVLHNSDTAISGLIASTSTNSIFENIAITINQEVLANYSTGSLVGHDIGSDIKNVVISNNYNVTPSIGSKVGAVIYRGEGTKVTNVLIKRNSSISNYYVQNVGIIASNVTNYTNMSTVGATIANFTDPEYKFEIENDKVILSKIIVNTTISFGGTNSGTSGSTVYINDLEADWNYYYGLNYASSSNGTLPTRENKNIYNETNLVKVQLTYSGIDPIGNLTGYVSISEYFSRYIYYKFFPVENGKVKIELIDNPFTNRPTNKGFNNWVVDGPGTITLDSTVYKRYLELDVSYQNGKPEDLVVSLHASWVDATVYNITANPTWSTVFSNLQAKTMIQVTTINRVYDPYDMGKSASPYYYFQVSIPRYSSTAGYYNQTEVLQNGTCNTNPSCTLYQRILPNAGNLFDPALTYYQRSGSNMAIVNPASIVGLTYTDYVIAPYTNRSMAGYYAERLIPRYDSIVGLYNSSGVLQTSGTCNTAAGCTYYELLQSKDNPVADVTTKYHYLVTRDTNIVVLRYTITNAWTAANQGTKPFTFTSVYNGTDYRNANYWNVSSANVQIGTDTTIENMRINSSQSTTFTSSPTPATANNTSRNLYGNFKNLKVGRGITTGTTNTCTFTSIIAGSTGTSGSASAATRYNLIVESGTYIFVILTNSTGTSNVYVNMNATYGSDFDRVTNNNSTFDVRFVATGSWGGNIRSTTTTTSGLNLTVKSGTFGSSKFDHTTGIYVGGRGGGTHYLARSIKVEGGYIYNIVGGPLSDTGRSQLNDIYIYQTGGEVDMIYGGAGQTATYGNRIISLTGGRVNYSVLAGSNGYNGASGDGTINGSGYIYIGGNSQIGNPTYVENNNVLYIYTSGNTVRNAGTEAGSVFGIGNGNTLANTIGSSDNSNIIIDGNARILRNVYGGGNYGATGISATANTNTTNIIMLNGIVEGDIYGGGNQNGAGSSSKISTININIHGGEVKGSVYGGANITGTIYGSIGLNVLSGDIKTNVYGGGRGSGTYVSRNVDVTIGSSSTFPTIRGNVYGGSAFGVVNATVNNTNASSYPTNVTIENGVVVNSVFGGGEGSASYTPSVAGNITVNVNDGSIGSVYGGNDQAGVPNGTVIVNLNGGNIGESYGGGNKSTVRGTNIRLQGGKTLYLFGGSNTLGAVTSTIVTLTSGEANYVFGGNNVGGSVATSNVYVNGGKVINELYGGGNLVYTGTTNVYLNNADIPIPYAFGGGKSANVNNANIEENGATIDKLFGGSNTSGTVLESTMRYISGTTNNVYGGNNAGGDTITANITITNGNITNLFAGGNQATSNTATVVVNNGTITNVFGGGNEAGITTSNTTFNGGTITNVYGGANTSGTVTNSNIKVQNNAATIGTIYGGNNLGGITENPTIFIISGNIGTIFGGGNLAATIKTSVAIDGGTIGTVYGGGNEASINQGTVVAIAGGTITGNVYGGGNFGTVDQNTKVNIKNATVEGSAYAGGNGATAIVIGNTNISIEGNSTIGTIASVAPQSGSVFGGGNAAATGASLANTSMSTVNIAGGSIYGNVYGGANTSVVYGTANVNIGINTITNTSLTKGDVYIRGTIFGGGEANAAGSEIYDYSFISVTSGIDVHVDGSSHTNFSMTGSIFGSGNASSAQGQSTITIKNYGTINYPQRNISIQRTDILTIDNSNIALSGASDRTNEYSDVPFTLSIIGDLHLQNNSALFLETGANLLRKWQSLDSGGNYAIVTINDQTGTVTKNVDNRVYLIEGKNLNIATNENVTSYGEVHGMTFFGMYTQNNDNYVNMGIYSPVFDYGDELNWGAMPAKGSYVLGLHKVNHNIQVDGFYSNFMDSETSTNKVAYIEPTPEDSNFYMWIIGEAIIEYNIDLVASKYSTLGTAELTFLEFSKPNTSFQILGFDYGGLNQGISLIDSMNIPKVAATTTQANTVMGLSMKSGNAGWLTKGETKFLSGNPSMTGTTYYVGENSTDVPSLLFYLYHSKNLTETAALGSVQISVMAVTRIDALTVETERLLINVNISTALYQTNEYEGSMTAGREYSMFASTVTNITSSSSISAYYSLYTEEANFYKVGYHRALVSDYILPLNTKITMIDFVNGNPVYYYHTIDNTDVQNATTEYSLHGEVSYNLSLFTKMGSIHGIGAYNDAAMNIIYANSLLNFSHEEFIFIISFEDTTINSDALNNSLVIELRDQNDDTITSVLGIQRLALNYNIYANKDAIIEVEGTIDPSLIYMGQEATLDINTNFVNSKAGANVVYDTRYFDSKLGINITVMDSNNQIVNGTSLLGIKFILDDQSYYPNLDGTTRIKIADKVGNVSTWFAMDTTNATLPSGSYTLRIESFGSPDGIFYGSTPSDIIYLPITVINEKYGLNSTASEHSVIFNAETGLNQLGEKQLSFDIAYHSGLENPNIRMRLSRRLYSTVYNTEYELVDLNDFVDQTLITTPNIYEYVVINNPSTTNRLNLIMNSNLRTGTYKIDFCLYDGNVLIGLISRYIIIK